MNAAASTNRASFVMLTKLASPRRFANRISGRKLHPGVGMTSPVRSVAALAVLVLAPAFVSLNAQMPVHTDLRPRVIRRAEGQRRYLADGRFMLLKIGPATTGSSYLFMGAEDLPPGTAIPAHQHEVDEELLIVHRGRVLVVFEHDSATAGPGDAVFLPARTRVSVRTLGSDTASIFFVFQIGRAHVLTPVT